MCVDRERERDREIKMKMSALSLPRRGHQDNHYRPEGSGTCLLCDCYPVGSFSRACERESGQCQCKPGVIGRQCDRCDNPFAEVSPNGCEGRRVFAFVFLSASLASRSGIWA